MSMLNYTEIVENAALCTIVILDLYYFTLGISRNDDEEHCFLK